MNARDWHIYGGLALALIGGCALSVPITLVIVGGVLAWLGIYAPGPRIPEPPKGEGV